MTLEVESQSAVHQVWYPRLLRERRFLVAKELVEGQRVALLAVAMALNVSAGIQSELLVCKELGWNIATKDGYLQQGAHWTVVWVTVGQIAALGGDACARFPSLARGVPVVLPLAVHTPIEKANSASVHVHTPSCHTC